jgi:hypothetical protein
MAGTACDAPAAYRPRRARDSPLYRLAETHHETFKQVYDERLAGRYGFWRAEVEQTLREFLGLRAPAIDYRRNLPPKTPSAWDP